MAEKEDQESGGSLMTESSLYQHADKGVVNGELAAMKAEPMKAEPMDTEPMDTDEYNPPLQKKIKTEFNGVDHMMNNSKPNHINGSKTEPSSIAKTEQGATDNHSSAMEVDSNSVDSHSVNSNSVNNNSVNNTSLIRHVATTRISQCELKNGASITNNSSDRAKARRENHEEEKPVAEECGEPEVITLSDSEDEFAEALSEAKALKISNNRALKLLKLHQDKLRSEESKLILLKKLRMSLSNSNQSAEPSNKPVDLRHHSASTSHRSSAPPPPLKRGMHQTSSSHQISSTKVAGHASISQTTPQSSHGHIKSSHSHSQSNGSAIGSSSTGPPPLVNMTKTPPSQGPSKKSTPAAPQLTAEQKLAAAKMALKKQLELSLQQIAAPKAPPPEVNFLPSLASGEFVCLLGMEEVVKYILSSEQKEVKYVFNPFSCVQCNTDFTPVWKRDKPGSKNVICEQCITSNQKRTLKQEHTAKLKSAFAKSLQKEQDLERRIENGSPLSDIPGINAFAAAASANSQHQNNSSSTALSTPNMPQLMPQLTAGSSSSSHLNSVSSNQITAAQLQHQALLQAQAAEQMRAMFAAQAMALPYPMYGVSSKQAADLQRQYLLDMINPSRSSWKT